MITMSCTHCYIQYGIPDEMHRQATLQGAAFKFYCPAGHPQAYGEGAIEMERRLRQRAEQEGARLADEARIAKQRAEQAERARLRAVGDLKRHKIRAANGTCPCCNRTFANMARHMKTKHPDFSPALRAVA